MQLAMDTINSANVPIRVVLDTAGEGRISFFDKRYKGATEHGQFIADYYLTTLMKDRDNLRGGLCLHGGFPNEWFVDGDTMLLVLQWARQFDF